MENATTATLYIVATPIGNLADITQRAIDTLQTVDLIAAEDTRHSGHLLKHYAIKTPTISLHDHNEQQRSEELLIKLQQGQSIALISDAGTPLISDPGYKLVALVREHHIPIIPITGSCALIAALSASGLPSDRFAFEGFLPPKQGARQKVLQAISSETRTLIYYESPRRLPATLADIVTVLGSDRRVCIARELTKLHETIRTQTAAELLEWVSNDSQQQKGECVLLIAGLSKHHQTNDAEINKVLNLLLAELPIKKAAAITASLLDVSKNTAYVMALKLQQK